MSKIKVFRYPNGAKIIYVQDKDAEFTYFNCEFRVGSVDEEKGKDGAAHFLEHMAFKSTLNMSEYDRKKTLNIMCANNNAYTGHYSITYVFSALNELFEEGFKIYNNFFKMAKSGLSYNDALKNAIEDNIVNQPLDIVKPLSVVIMGHGYNLFDERISLNIIKKLEKMDVKVYTSLNVSREDSLNAIDNIGEIQYWANELELTGTAAYYLNNHKVDGIIALSAFGCGPDSLMVDEMAYHCKENEMPLIHLTIDEHTGEAGFITRLEAFVDMLMRKKRAKMSVKPKSTETSKNDVVVGEEKVLISVAK